MTSNKKFQFENEAALSLKEIKQMYDNFINPGLSKLYQFFSFGKEVFIKSEGMYMHTREGKKILDFTGGLGVLNHGHNHPRILKARIKYQEEKRIEVHKVIFSPYQAMLAKKLASLLPEDLNKSFFPNSGAEANEGALKLAYKYYNGKRNFVLHADRAFHGKLIASGSLGGNYAEEDGLFQKLPYTSAFEYNNIESFKSKINYLRTKETSDVYAVIIEPFSASCMYGCSESFLLEMRKICDQEQIILIFDEVYSGWSKTGHLFNFMRVKNLCPDILTMSKSFGGGKSSISAYVTRDKVFNKAYGKLKDSNLHTTTYTGFGEEAATALEAIQIVIDDNYSEKARDIFNQLNPKLKEMKKKFPSIIKEVRGQGTMNGILIYPPIKYMDEIIDKLPYNIIKDKYNAFSQIVIASIMEELYSEYKILTIPQDRIIKKLSGEIERFAYLAIKPACIATSEEINYFLSSLEKVLNISIVNLIRKLLQKKILK